MSPETAQEVCAALYIAAGREATEDVFAVWARALDECPDADADAIVLHILRTVDFGKRGAPSPAMFLSERERYLWGNLPEWQRR